MGVQASRDISSVPFIRSGVSFAKENETIEKDTGRSIVLKFGTVMAKKNVSVPTTGTADGGNTGNGTMTGVAAAPGSVKPLVGDYTLKCTFVVTNGGVFNLTDPSGDIIADNLTLRVGAGLLTTFAVGGLVFIVTDGSTDFDAGDLFVVAVTSVNKWVPIDLTAVDGSEVFAGIYLGAEILAAAIVAADIPTSPMLVGGACTIDENQLVFENSAALATVQADGRTLEQAMAGFGIFSEDTIDIDEFENS